MVRLLKSLRPQDIRLALICVSLLTAGCDPVVGQINNNNPEHLKYKIVYEGRNDRPLNGQIAPGESVRIMGEGIYDIKAIEVIYPNGGREIYEGDRLDELSIGSYGGWKLDIGNDE